MVGEKFILLKLVFLAHKFSNRCQLTAQEALSELTKNNILEQD